MRPVNVLFLYLLWVSLSPNKFVEDGRVRLCPARIGDGVDVMRAIFGGRGAGEGSGDFAVAAIVAASNFVVCRRRRFCLCVRRGEEVAGGKCDVMGGGRGGVLRVFDFWLMSAGARSPCASQDWRRWSSRMWW